MANQETLERWIMAVMEQNFRFSGARGERLRFRAFGKTIRYHKFDELGIVEKRNERDRETLSRNFSNR